MNTLFSLLPFLFAEGEAANPASGLLSMAPAILAMVVFYMFLIHRPQKREQQARFSMLKSLKKNDRVLTTGGIYAVVTNVQTDVDRVTVCIDENNNTKMKLSLSAIARVIADEPTGEKETK